VVAFQEAKIRSGTVNDRSLHGPMERMVLEAFKDYSLARCRAIENETPLAKLHYEW
jgi:hypothetical protein